MTVLHITTRFHMFDVIFSHYLKKGRLEKKVWRGGKPLYFYSKDMGF